uniref:Uncharacterized protein n=1 Tax=Arundo donax TaxID=35708 RepID=A0A0A9ADN3_ARUDO
MALIVHKHTCCSFEKRNIKSTGHHWIHWFKVNQIFCETLAENLESL